jgi:hypothetical protein
MSFIFMKLDGALEAHASHEFIRTEWLGYIAVSPECQQWNHVCHTTAIT